MKRGIETSKWRWLLCLLAVSVLVWFVLKYLFILFLPLIFAFILTRLVYPAAIRLKKLCKKMHISLSSKICRITVFIGYIFAAGSFFLWIGMKIFSQLRRFLENIGVYKAWLESLVYKCCCQCDGLLGFSNGETFRKMQTVFVNGNESFWQENLSKLPISAVSLFGIAGRVGLVLLFSILLTMMALMNLERWYFSYRHCGFYKECHEILRELTGAGYAYVRTQVIIIFCIATLCVLGLFFIGNSYAFLAGIGIAVIDALPVLGSGTIFFPWIIIEIIMGHFGKACILILLYAGCQLIRQTLEPKLMGQKLQIEPAIILASIFAGLRLFSIAGVILGPIGFLLIRAIMRLIILEFPELKK